MPAERTCLAREITQQASTVQRTLGAVLSLSERIAEIAAKRHHSLLVARGSSDNAAGYARYLIEAPGRRLGRGGRAGHGHPRPAQQGPLGHRAVSISQSGETSEILETQAWARANGAATIAITANADSSLARAADMALVTKAGPERAVPATTSYTGQRAALACLTAALTCDPDPVVAELRRIPGEIERLIQTTDVTRVTEQLARAEDVPVAGRGLLPGTSQELALKLEETCLPPVRGLSHARVRHRPIAVVDRRVTALLVSAAAGPLAAGMGDLGADLGSRGATIVQIGGKKRFRAASDPGLPGPDLSEATTPSAIGVPAQLAVEALARELGLDPDAPRGLHKVTQTEPGGG